MTTREFSATKLPHPRYSLEVGRLSLDEHHKTAKLPNWIPRFSDKIQLIEVKRAGSVFMNGPSGYYEETCNLLGEYVVIESVRPELFLRRDFISKFVDNGAVYISSQYLSTKQMITPTTGAPDPGYYLFTSSENTLSLMLHEKVYRRFGLIGKRICHGGKAPKAKPRSSIYQVDIDLRDKRIKESNKHHDKLVQTLRRLGHIDKVYFRFVPFSERSLEDGIAKAPEGSPRVSATESLDFFKSVIREYELDGFKPVPLTNCHRVCRELERKWTNYNQRHPRLSVDLLKNSSQDGLSTSLDKGQLPDLISLIDWLGFQMLSLDCDKTEIGLNYLDRDDTNGVDVHCSVISGVIDFEEFHGILRQQFASQNKADRDDSILLRAFILCTKPLESMVKLKCSNSSVNFLQDCDSNEASSRSLVTVVGISSQEDSY